MRLGADDETVLADLASRGGALIERAVTWCATPSGSRNLPGLKAQGAVLADTLAALPGTVDRLALPSSSEIGPYGGARLQPHADALRLTIRPEAPLQVVLV